MNDSAYERLGSAVAKALDEEQRGAHRIRQRAAVIDALQAGASPAKGGRSWIAIAAAAIVVAAIAIGWALRAADPEGGPGLAAGQWLHASNDAAVEVAVGTSRLRLEPGARARVGEADADAVEIVLEHGGVIAEVDPEAGAKWKVVAGPYAVEVVGTVFEVRWAAARQRLEVSVQRGQVRVRGAELGAGGVLLAAGESVTAGGGVLADGASGGGARAGAVGDGEAARASVGAGDEARASAAGSGDVRAGSASDRDAARTKEVMRPGGDGGDPGPAPEAGGTARTPVDGGRSSAKHGGAKASGSWRSLALAGHFADALTAADAQGFDDIATSSSAADLKLLADTARLGGDPARARDLLVSLRDRFDGTDEAARAAFDLGRMAKREPKAAAKWFAIYLAERPTGSYAREASGRLVEALHKSGQTSEARTAAARYLADHPNGPHAPLARSLVDG